MTIHIGGPPRPPTSAGRPVVEVYGDESLKRGHYDLLGGLWIPARHAVTLREAIAEVRTRHGCTVEIKWTKCSGSSVHPVYAEVVDLVMAAIDAGRAKFKCIVIDRRLVDNAAWNDGDRELGYFKAWWTLLLSRVQPGWRYRVRLDALNLQRSGRLLTLRDTLNAAAMRDRGLGYPCCESVEPRDSKKDDLIQVVDLLTGAVGFHYAAGHLAPGASRGKIEMAERLCAALGKPGLCFESKPSETSFNVWKWRPRRAKTQRAP
ncbi:MAG TPA: DUF3800 domain-containing protein [Longimicrobium sp.]|nr:DUF3800 domain-containing protein [Longimicrobium sp.]